MMKKELIGLKNLKRNKMTAVEWLQEQYTKQITFLHREDFEQAKEMEKQQHMHTYFSGWHRNNGNREEDFEQYYNETFNK